MKKTLINLILILAISLSLFFLVGFGMKNDSSIGIIGGADGPTAMMVTTSLVNCSLYLSMVFAAARYIAVIVVVFILYKRQK